MKWKVYAYNLAIRLAGPNAASKDNELCNDTHQTKYRKIKYKLVGKDNIIGMDCLQITRRVLNGNTYRWLAERNTHVAGY